MKTIVFVVLTVLLAAIVVANVLLGGSVWLTAISASLMFVFESATFVAERNRRSNAPQVLYCAQRKTTKTVSDKITGKEVALLISAVMAALVALRTSGHEVAKGDLNSAFWFLVLTVTLVVAPFAYHMAHKHHMRFWQQKQ